MIRIKCINNRSVRIIPAESESYHWIDLEQAGYTDNSIPLAIQPAGLVFYYDIIDQRTLFITPPVSQAFNLEIDYVPMRRPLFYTNAGLATVTNASTALTGTDTTWASDGVETQSTRQLAEVIVGTKDLQSNLIRIDKDYPRVASITSNTVATLVSAYAGPTVASTPLIIAMVPVLPREYHRWITRLTSALMLSKINPELSDKYSAKFMAGFTEEIQPVIRRRQSQDSRVVEDAEEFSAGGDW
jgi:hypothetical protein